MPFLGQDWRSPGWRWVKTEDGWKRCEPFSPALEDGNNQLNDISHTVLATVWTHNGCKTLCLTGRTFRKPPT